MNTLSSGQKAAATRQGISWATYARHVDAGEKWCSGCKEWHTVDLFGSDRSRPDGVAAACRASLAVSQRARYQPVKERKKREVGRRYVAARDGDIRQAHGRIQYLVNIGHLRPQAEVPCVDCGHLGPDRVHEYDHHLGYAPEHHEDVECVCKPCHVARGVQRRRADKEMADAP